MKNHLKVTLIFLITACFSTGTQAQDYFSRVRIGISGGAGYMFASTRDAERDLIRMGIDKHKVKDFYDNYKSGWQGDADIHIMVGSHVGVGAKYALFSTSAKMKNVSLGNYNGDGLHHFFGDFEDQLYINYIGPSCFGQYFINRRKTWKATAMISYGYVNYRSENHILEVPSLITGHSFGGYGEFGMERHLGNHVSIGAKLDYFASLFRKFKVETNQVTQTVKLSGKDLENVSRCGISLGLRIYL